MLPTTFKKALKNAFEKTAGIAGGIGAALHGIDFKDGYDAQVAQFKKDKAAPKSTAG